jgi:hypothetical protein
VENRNKKMTRFFKLLVRTSRGVHWERLVRLKHEIVVEVLVADGKC